MTDLDEALERLHRTGPEFEGWLSNHGPMAADALVRLGRADVLARWVTAYERRLEDAPRARWRIDPGEWREALGDPTRLGDWCALLVREVHERPWTDVLEQWWPRLLPGALASATHGLIRTGHAVRSLRDQETGPRLTELGLALGYWGARWQPLPGGESGRSGTAGHGSATLLAAYDALPAVHATGGIRTRLAALDADPAWPASRDAVAAPAVSEVPAALDAVVDAAVTRYAAWAHRSPVMLVHAATAPRAAGLVLASLPTSQWARTHDLAWAASAAVTAAYRPGPGASRPPADHADTGGDPADLEAAVEACVATGDEHAIKLAETAAESAARGTAAAAGAARAAASLIG